MSGVDPHFVSLVLGLARQAEEALDGKLPPVEGGPGQPREVARALIDTLGMLEEKTRGHLSDEEARVLGEVLTALRFRFVKGEAR
ncbi:MAG TPA: DUF1844 domain-containing protein [Gemmatimonadales bacterium]|jgi:hypothetical protein|nr:DUF1844 domain-containing protein [Gemmatimonadales bacterium]